MSTTPVFDDLFHAAPGMMGGGAVSPAELEQLRSELHEQVERQDWWRVADIACRLANVHVDPPCNTSKGAKDLDQWEGPPHRREAVQ